MVPCKQVTKNIFDFVPCLQYKKTDLFRLLPLFIASDTPLSGHTSPAKMNTPQPSHNHQHKLRTMASNSSAGSGTVMDVLDRVIGLPSNSSDGGTTGNHSKFLPSPKFSGAKPGYVFKSADLGTGYYYDELQQQLPKPQQLNNAAKKRPRFNNGDENDEQQPEGEKKRGGGVVRFDSTRDTTKLIPPNNNKKQQKQHQLSGDELLAQAEEQQQQSKTIYDTSSRGIQLSSTSLSKTLTKNQLLRAQHSPHSPEKFMMNELALHDEIQSFISVAVHMKCYMYLVEYGIVNDFITCLNHENSDIAMSVLSVLVELMDPMLLQDDDNDDETKTSDRVENMNILVSAFITGGGLELLISNLGRYDEGVVEDAKGVEDTLTLVEALLDMDRAGVLRLDGGGGGGGGDNDDDAKMMTAATTARMSSIVSCICQQTTFLSWLFQRIEKSNDNDEEMSSSLITATADKPVSPAVIKLHASEVLSAILQHEDYSGDKNGLCKLSSLPKYSSAFCDDDGDDGYDGNLDKKPAATTTNDDDGNKPSTIDGMEILLLAIATFRKQDPQVEVDCEFLENVFDALAASLLREDNVADFVEAEGIELMLRCLRQKVHAGGGALKVFNFALSGTTASSSLSNVYRNACETFVSAGGLKVIFPLYMSRKSSIPCPAACSEGGSDLAKKGGTTTSSSSKRAKRAAQARKRWLVEVEQNAINVMYSLTRHIVQDSKYDAHSRLLVKFVEEDCEKCDRTIELCLKYDEKARLAEYQYFRSDAAEVAEQMGVDIELAALDAKLRGGGDIFHRTCAILSFACVYSKRCHGHVLDQLKLKGSGITVIKEGLIEFANLLADGPQKLQIEQFISEI